MKCVNTIALIARRGVSSLKRAVGEHDIVKVSDGELTPLWGDKKRHRIQTSSFQVWVGDGPVAPSQPPTSAVLLCVPLRANMVEHRLSA
jgi:hypothetical protein